MTEQISLLLNINFLFFSFSYTLAFCKISGGDYKFRKRIKALENIFPLLNIRKKNDNKTIEKKKKFIESISFFIVIIIFTVLMVAYFFMFYNFIINNYDDRFWYISRLVCTPFVFLILPFFLPSMLNNLFYGFFKYEFGKSHIENPISNRFSFAFDCIWVLVILTILTLFVSWEVDIAWFSLLILELIILIIIAKIFGDKRSKLI